MSNELVKGSGCGTREWREDFVLTGTDGLTAFFGVGQSGGMLTLGNNEVALTAHSGGTQAGALAVSATQSIHVVSTVAAANDSIKLPASTGKGQVHIVSNQAAANSLQLFGAGTDTINGVATATGIAVAAGKSALCIDYGAGTWFAIVG